MEKHINLKNYLKQILDLEIEKNRLEQIESKIQILINNNLNPIDKNKYIDFDEIEKKKSNEIQQYKDKNKIKKPVIPKKPEEPTKLKPNPLILLIVGIIEFILGIGINFAFVYVLGGFIAVLSFFGIVSQISINNNYKKQIEIYENALLNYNNEIKKYNESMSNSEQNVKEYFNKIQKKYDKELKEKKKLFEKKLLQIKTIKEDNKKLLSETKNNINLVNTKLEKLYDLDIIFEKYRNLIAIASFYEYFSSSRVSKLEGRDGAYNLFESEIRQNIIIMQLDTINSNLNAIKQNQYILYEELNKINDSLNNINNYVSNIKDIVYDIKNVEIDTNVVNKCILNCSNQINKKLSIIKSINIAKFYLN